MSDGLSAEEKIQRAREVERLLGDPLIVEAFAVIEAEVFEEWKRTDPDETVTRERLWMVLEGQAMFREVLRRWLDSGKVEATTALQEASEGGSGRADA